MNEVVGVEEARGVGGGVRLTTKQREWLHHIERCESEGLSFSSYCRREGLDVRRLYAAASALRAKGCLTSESTDSAVPRLSAVKLTTPLSTPTVLIELPDGIRLTWSVTDVGSVAALVHALSSST